MFTTGCFSKSFVFWIFCAWLNNGQYEYHFMRATFNANFYIYPRSAGQERKIFLRLNSIICVRVSLTFQIDSQVSLRNWINHLQISWKIESTTSKYHEKLLIHVQIELKSLESTFTTSTVPDLYSVAILEVEFFWIYFSNGLAISFN